MDNQNDKSTENKPTKKAPTKSYVISVSIQKGCYRHIQIESTYTLEDLSSFILWAFDFVDDHAHAFFMNNRGWDDSDCYYADFVDEDGEYRHTSNYKLGEIDLEVGDKFLYIFDFGEEWRFSCRVLKVLDEKTNDPMIVRLIGKPPAQYDEWDDEWDDEE